MFSVVHRPLVVGEIQKQLEHKTRYARSLDGPRLILFAGSNGRYSHRCEPLRERLGRPCVNASIGIGIGLDVQLAQWLKLLRAGDIVYMPLEYSQFRFTRAEMEGGLQAAWMVHSRREQLWALDARRIAAAYGSFDLPFLIHGLAEMALDGAGFRRRSSTESLTPQGDESGHTAAVGTGYAGVLASSKVDTSRVPEVSDAIGVVEAFLDDARRAGVTVVGGLPTLPEVAAIDPVDIERLRRLYESRGHRFLALPNRSLYPLGCFFDTPYHLNETCQIEHSRAVANALAAALDRVGRP